MQRRSAFDIWLPFAFFAVLCLTSIPGLIFALSWMTIGMMAIGHRGLDSFPRVEPDVRWRSGYRSAAVWFYHIAWWPWYVRRELTRWTKRILLPVAAAISRDSVLRDSARSQQRADSPPGEHVDLSDAPPAARRRNRFEN